MSSRKLLKNCLQVVQSTSAMFDSFPKGCWDVAQVSTGALEYGFRSGILAVRVKARVGGGGGGVLYKFMGGDVPLVPWSP